MNGRVYGPLALGGFMERRDPKHSGIPYSTRQAFNRLCVCLEPHPLNAVRIRQGFLRGRDPTVRMVERNSLQESRRGGADGGGTNDGVENGSGPRGSYAPTTNRPKESGAHAKYCAVPAKTLVRAGTGEAEFAGPARGYAARGSGGADSNACGKHRNRSWRTVVPEKKLAN